MKKCPRCENEQLKEDYKYCKICGWDLSIDKNKLIDTLKGVNTAFWTKLEKEALEYAIEELERTAPEVPVQEQLIKLLNGITLSQWEQLKICVDREFKSQINKCTFEIRDSFKEILDLEINQ